MADSGFMAIIGFDTASALTDNEVDAFREGLGQVHLADVVDANFGVIGGRAYKLVESDASYERAPGWLTLYEMDGLDALEAFSARLDRVSRGECGYRHWTDVQRVYRWRLLWRGIGPADRGVALSSKPYLRLVGTDLPSTTATEDLEEFDRFYSETHMPEVMVLRQYVRGSRYKLHRDLGHPPPGAPQFVAAYEGDEASRSGNGRPAGARTQRELTAGPPVWASRKVRWYSMFGSISSYQRRV